MDLRSNLKRLTALLLSMLLLLGLIPAGSVAFAAQVEKAPLQVALMSDIHYYPLSLMGSRGDAWQDYCKMFSRQFDQAQALLDAALTAVSKHAAENDCKYLFLPGDLTKDGEYEGHVELAQRLELFEAETGIKVIVTNGNHDLNNSNASGFVNDKEEPARKTGPEEFREIYKNLGYDLAHSTYTPPAGEKAGMLSYSVRLDGGYRLIVLDTCKYSADSTASGKDEHETGGNVSEALWAWALSQAKEAEAAGETIIGMMHQNAVKQFGVQDSMFQAFVVDKWVETAESLADAGMKYVFTGHTHMTNIATHTSDKGNSIVDCQTASLTGFPNHFREVRFDNTGLNPKADFKTFDVDCEKQIVTPSRTFEKPYNYNFSFGQTYGHDGLARFGADMAQGFLGKFIADINEQGGLYEFLIGPTLDLDKILDDALKGGLSLGSAEIFTVNNLLSFIKDLADQIDAKFLADPQVLFDLVYNVADKAVKMQVSDYPCTNFIDLLGFGDPGRPGNLEEAAYSVLAYAYRGDEDISDDPFMLDVIDYFRNRDGGEKTFNHLKDLLINDLIEDTILSSLEFHPGTVFPKDSMLAVVGIIIDAIMNALFPNNQSFYNIIYSLLAIVPQPYNSVEGIVDAVLGEYLTSSQYEAWGYTIADIIEGFVVDTNPGVKMDNNVLIENASPAPVVVSTENYRLPSHIAVTFGDDSASTRNITWHTKYSVTGTDIELIPFSENPIFTGSPTKSANIKSSYEKVTRSYPGADLGIWGLLDYEFDMIRHTVEITGLAPGSKFLYRVGDAALGWWSETGTIETADNSDAFTFFHMTDPQGQNVRHYASWAKLVDKAFTLFPQSKFILSSGDLVDNKKNFRHWQNLFNSAAPNLMNTALMTTVGNHEDSGAVIDKYFNMPTAPEQDRESGLYYSYDYNNAHFIVLNTNSLNDKKGLDQKQLDWLKADAAASDAQWKILSLHKAIYSNGSHYNDGDVSAIRKQLSSLLPELGIDLVLQGHDHVYLRTDAMSGNKIVKSESKAVSYKGRDYQAKQNPQGSVYVISACAGVKNYAAKNAWATDLYFPRAQSIVTVDDPVFSAIQIDGNKLYFDAFALETDSERRIDSFAIVKTNVTENKDSENSNSGNNGTKENSANEQVKADKQEVASTATPDNSLDAIPQTGGNNSNEVIIISAFFLLSAYAAFMVRKKKKQSKNA